MLMSDVFEAVEEAVRFRGMKADVAASDAAGSKAVRDRKDMERAAKRRAGYKWSVEPRDKDDDPGQAPNKAILTNQYGPIGVVTWYDDDESRTKFRAETPVPGVRGQWQIIGRFVTLDQAKNAIEKEVD